MRVDPQAVLDEIGDCVPIICKPVPGGSDPMDAHFIIFSEEGSLEYGMIFGGDCFQRITREDLLAILKSSKQ